MNGLTQTQQLRSLAGLDDERVTRVRAAIEHLDMLTTSWPTFGPSPVKIADAIRQTDAIARGLRELRDDLVAQGAAQ